MPGTLEVSDLRSNAPEQILHAVETIGRSDARRKVFEAVYHHKSRIKSATLVADMTGLTKMRVLQVGRELADAQIVNQVSVKGEGTAYEQIRFYQSKKRKILSLVGDPTKALKIPSKRKHAVVNVKSRQTGGYRPRAELITVDDIDSFARVRKIRTSKTLPSSVSEDDFKKGIQSILGEPGTFKDWGGETSDLFSTRLVLKEKRRAAAFGFKGPGLRGPLVPSRMGTNGDQIPRLFKEPSDVFLVQHWREIKPSILELMSVYARDKSAHTGKPVFYGIIDGQDSERIRIAYQSSFKKK